MLSAWLLSSCCRAGYRPFVSTLSLWPAGPETMVLTGYYGQRLPNLLFVGTWSWRLPCSQLPSGPGAHSQVHTGQGYHSLSLSGRFLFSLPHGWLQSFNTLTCTPVPSLCMFVTPDLSCFPNSAPACAVPSEFSPTGLATRVHSLSLAQGPSTP